MASIPQTGRRQNASSLHPDSRQPSTHPRRISLAWWLTLPLASLVLISTLLVGGLLLRQNQQATDDLSQQLEQEISDRVLTQLATWIEQPQNINQLNQTALLNQSISLTQPDQLTQHFLTQLQTLPGLHQLIVTDAQGRSISLSREPLRGYRLQHTSIVPKTASLPASSVASTTSTNKLTTETLLLDINGDTAQTLPPAPPEDLRQADWYQQARSGSMPIWVKAFNQGETIAAQAAPGNHQANHPVVATVLDLSHISLFLTQLKLPPQAQVFVLDDSGLLLSSSTQEASHWRDRQGQWIPHPAPASQDPITQATANYLIPRWPSSFPQEAQPFSFDMDGKTIRGQTLSYEPYEGANWLIAIALPEATILAPIHAQQRQLLILCLGLLLLSLLLCRWLAQWITRPLRNLNRATQALGQGNWKLDLSDGLSQKRGDELGELSRSFDWMSGYLQDNFRQLEGQKHQLQQRNQALNNEKSRLEELDRFKDEFLTTTTQELRIPLSGILGLAESLQAQALHPQNGNGSPGQHKNSATNSQQEASREAAIELIIFSARRLTTLVNDLLDLSKAKNDSLKLSCAGIELHRVAQHVLALCAPLAAPKKLRLINNITSAFPLAYGDSQRVQQIFYHLINNAIKFTPDGEISISAEIIIPESSSPTLAKLDPQIAAHRAAQGVAQGLEKKNAAPIRHLSITISDTGVGLTPELETQLSQAFQRPSGSTSHRYGGTGLGLTIVQTFVELHGGRVEAKSSPTQGSQFRFTLPILEAAAVRTARPKQNPASQASTAPNVYTTRSQASASSDRITAIQPKSAIQPKTAIQSPPNIQAIPAELGDTVVTKLPARRPAISREERPAENLAEAKEQEIYSTLIQRTAVQPQSHEEFTTHTLPLLDSAARSAALLADAQLRRNASETTELKRDRKPRARILIIDDDAINLEVLLRQLSLDDYQVVSATNGEEALKMLDPNWGHESFDLVILEVMMPRMSGYEVCRRLRKHYPSYQLPVIMLTAKVQVQDVVEGFRAGANDYLRKPFSSDELRSRIQTHLTNRLYARFVPAHFLQFLRKSSIADINLGNQVSCDMTVMFSDIRSFTTLSESMSPQENFDFINRYFQCVSPEVRRHNGFIVKYLGDGMMAIFPESTADAIAAGIAQLKQINQANQASCSISSRPPIQVGIGIHHGPMMVGIVGEAQRMQGDAFSDDVNLTARLEGLTKFYGVSMLITNQVLEQLESNHPFHIRLLDKVQVKGRVKPLPIYEVFDGDNAESCDRKAQTRPHFEAGIHCYQAGAFVAAQGHFRAVIAAHPQDRPAKLYCRRVAKLIAKPPEEAWTGISTWGRK